MIYLLDDLNVQILPVSRSQYESKIVSKKSIPKPGGFASCYFIWFGYLNQDHAHYYYTEYLDDNEGRLELTGNTESREHYSHDLMAERALEFIKESKDVPFFLYAAFTLPHFSSKKEDADGFAVPSTEPYKNKDWDEISKDLKKEKKIKQVDLKKKVVILNL